MNFLEHLADRIHHTQQRRGKFRVERKLAVPKPRQQVLANVGNFFELVKTQESAGALDGVDGAKHAAQRVAIVGIFLQPDQFPIQPVQVLVTLDQKILDDVAVAHRCRSFLSSK